MRTCSSLVLAAVLAITGVLAEPCAFASWPGGLAHAAGFFVSPNGSNSASGSIAQPWRTIQFALDALLAGDTLYVRGGVYYETPTAAVNGTAAAPIVIRSYPGETAVLDSGSPQFRIAGNSDWELVDAGLGEYRSAQPVASGDIYAYVAGIPSYENERVALVPYTDVHHFRATTDQFGGAFYVGPGTFRVGDRVHVRLAKTSDLRSTESRYGTVFATENADPRQYAIVLSTASTTLRISGTYLEFRDLVFHQAKETVRFAASAHHITLAGVTVWHGDSALEVLGAHHITVTDSRIYGDFPYWVFWSDMKDAPYPANRMRGTSIDLRAGAHDVEIAYSHVRGSGNDLIGTNDDEYNLFVHHCRIENAGDDAFELEGTTNVGRVEIYENFIRNVFVAVAPAQDTPNFSGPLLVYRNVMALLRNPPVNRAEGINTWNGGYRYGFEYLFKHGSHAPDVSRNAHYYHNTLVLLNSDDRGMNITPTDPSNCRIANNIEYVVNGRVNRDFRTAPGLLIDGNLYRKLNDADRVPLLANYTTVPGFHSATGLESNGIGSAPGLGTDPLLTGLQFNVLDATRTRWEIDVASEQLSMADFIPSAGSPVIGAGIEIPAVPGLGTLPDTRASRDIGALPFGTSPAEFEAFPFDPGHPAPTLVGVLDSDRSAAASTLHVWPVPYRGGELTVSFSAAGRAGSDAVDVAIYDLAGRRVCSLAYGWFPSGEHRVHWNGRDRSGGRVATGIYLVRATRGTTHQTRKFVIAR